jgi:hypothetical protein
MTETGCNMIDRLVPPIKNFPPIPRPSDASPLAPTYWPERAPFCCPLVLANTRSPHDPANRHSQIQAETRYFSRVVFNAPISDLRVAAFKPLTRPDDKTDARAHMAHEGTQLRRTPCRTGNGLEWQHQCDNNDEHYRQWAKHFPRVPHVNRRLLCRQGLPGWLTANAERR